MMIRDDFNGGDCIGFGCLKDEFDDMRREVHYKNEEAWKKLRHLMAVIFVRERKGK